ncbi:24524_t:CDS:2, partial [Cetraspora pellucida]
YVTGQAREQMEEAEWLIELDFQIVKDMLDPVVKKIINLIQRHCASTERRPAAMFLVVPKHPIAAIERGALEYGLNLDVVQTRILKYCYGVEVVHDPPQRRTPSERFFHRLALRGVEVARGIATNLLGKLKIDLSDSQGQKKSKGFSFTLKKRVMEVMEVALILTFRTMEIKATAINKMTGQIYKDATFVLEF